MKDRGWRKKKECNGENISFESFNSIYPQLPFNLTDSNVSATDKEGDDNMNETDYV